MRNILKGLFIVIACLMASSAWAEYPTPIANLNFEITSSTTAMPANYEYSASNTPSLKTQNSIKCIIISDGGGSNAPTFNGSAAPSGGKRWMAFCPAVDCEVTIGIMSNKKKFFIQNKGGEFYSYTNKANAVEEQTVKGLKAGEWYAMCGGSSQVYITKMTFKASGPVGPSTDATLKSIVYGTAQTPVPGFAADKLSYEVELPAESVSAPSVQATANDPKATVSYTQATTLPGTAKIDVTAEDGTTKKQYTVTFTKASAAPKVETATWANIKGTAVIDQVNKTITGQVKNGSSLTLTPSFTGKNIASWTPNTAQNFSTGSIEYTFTSSSSETTKYTVSITEAPATSTDATLKSLTYGDKSVPNFSPTTYTYNIELTEGIKTPPTIAAETNDAKATKVITQAPSVPGSGKVEVTAEDGETKLTYTINYTVVVPPTKLTLHVPEVYEAKEIAGGYGGTLSEFEGHEYEVYYCSYDSSGNLSFTVTPIQKRVGISGEPRSETAVRARDNWFEGTATGGKSNFSFTNKDEYIQGSGAMHKLKNGNTYTFHIKGYEEFSFLGKDNNADASKGRHFEVYVDDVLQPMTVSASATIRRFTITTDEHVIKLKALHDGDSNNELYGFSLRVAQEPRTKYLRGNDSTQTVMQTQTIQPITYVTKYNNISGAETRLEWIGNEATGITLQKIDGSLTDTLVVSGTAQCKVGTYNYAVVAYYNNVETSRATGSFKVATDIRPMTELNAEVYQNEEMDQIKFRYYALSADSVKLTWPSSQPAGITGKGAANNTYIIGGIPTATEGLYPYEITIAGADTVFKGVIKVKKLDYGTNPVLYLHKNTGADEKDGVYAYLVEKGWNLIARKAKEDGMRSEDQYNNYKWILISEDADANNVEILGVARGEAKLPVLNMNAFSYAYESDAATAKWGEPDNGSISKGGCFITVQRDDHPIFKALNKKNGDQIQVIDTVNFKGLMPINVLKQGTLCLATSPTRDIEDYEADGEMQTIIHEIPKDLHQNRKYICFPIAKNSSKKLTADGKKVIDAIVNYLTNSDATVAVPEVKITGFSVNGVAGEIDQEKKTIQVNIDRTKYPDLDLKEATPEITVASPYTFVVPASKDTVDLSTSAVLPVKYTVSDYINRCTYNVTVILYSPEGIEEVYTVGEWVNVYDIFGRKITTTNEDIFTMSLPRGVYVIVTESGQTIKIAR